METISQRWAKFALKLKYDSIPPEAIKEAKRFLLDSVGCAFSALDNKDTIAAYNYIRDLGGKEQATIIGWGEKTNLPLATLMNSLLIRALDYNDIYWEQDPSHPSDISPAVLSTGEFMKKNGKEVLVGIIIAYELEMRLCLAAFPGVREIGWHHATLTQFVSPVVAGKMLGLSKKEIVAAIGISGSSHLTLGGVVAGHLTNMKNAADSFAVEAGVRAALLASKGYTGPVEVFEGKEGLFEVLNKVKWNKDVLTKGLGEEFLINQCGYKAFPTEALTHQPITAAIEVMKENNLDPKEIKEVLVETTTRGADILSDPSKYKPTTKETADHSLPYCIAVAVAKGNVLPSDFEDDTLRDPFVWSLLDKIKVVANPEIDALFPKVKRAIVTIKTPKGEFKKQEDFAKGQPERPLSEEELISKFKANSEKKISSSRMENIIKTTQELENINEIGKYMELLINDK
ncbi:2-methylcitrate dehydratase [subsurface metagenome]